MAVEGNRSPLLGAVEGGGTKFQCALAQGVDAILMSRTLPTTTPEQTLGAVVEFFVDAQARYGTATAFGIGCFGPLDLQADSAMFGRVLSTPKRGWSDVDLLEPFARFAKPLALDTDVNAAALAEAAAHPATTSLVYVTVGTGIGAGAILGGRPLHGLLHPEMGHIPVRRDPRDTAFPGVCAFHGDCLEGLACGPAITARWGATIAELGATHPAASIIGGYLGQLATSIALTLSPERIVFGGGVMRSGAVLPHVRQQARALINGYLPRAALQGSLESYLIAPRLGERSGLIGALRLALGALPAALTPDANRR